METLQHFVHDFWPYSLVAAALFADYYRRSAWSYPGRYGLPCKPALRKANDLHAFEALDYQVMTLLSGSVTSSHTKYYADFLIYYRYFRDYSSRFKHRKSFLPESFFKRLTSRSTVNLKDFYYIFMIDRFLSVSNSAAFDASTYRDFKVICLSWDRFPQDFFTQWETVWLSYDGDDTYDPYTNEEEKFKAITDMYKDGFFPQSDRLSSSVAAIWNSCR